VEPVAIVGDQWVWTESSNSKEETIEYVMIFTYN